MELSNTGAPQGGAGLKARPGVDDAGVSCGERPDIPRRDLELSRRIEAGDPDAEEVLIEEFQPGLTAIARVRADESIAADLVQETFVAALENLRGGRWRAEGPLGAYLAAILRRQIRRARAFMTLPAQPGDPAERADYDPGPGWWAERSEQIRRVRAALDRLPSQQRDVLTRHYLDGQSVAHIGRALRIPRGTVLSRLFHARVRLRRLLNQSRVR